MSRNGQEILFEGWLTKSPPTKRIWRGRWRRRWFTLHPGELPGQFVLSYYTDRNSRKLKGFIDLDQCEQVDVGLKFEDKKLKFDYMFDIKTPSRTYYLAADTQDEMKLWVKCICNICALKPTSDDDDFQTGDSQQVSSSPYIPISECITGKTPVLPNQPINKDFNALLQHNIKSSYFKTKNHAINDTYDLQPPTYLNFDPSRVKDKPEPSYYNFDQHKNSSPLQSPTDSESVFTDDDWTHNTINSDQSVLRQPRPSNSSSGCDAAPPRPPKSSSVSVAPPSYFNLGNIAHSKSNSMSDDNPQNLISDEMYDFPRSHVASSEQNERRHCYNNAAPSSIDGAQGFTYNEPVPGQSPKPSTSGSSSNNNAQVFRYGDDMEEPPPSPALSQTSAQYSNLPSPSLLPSSDAQLMPPPKVNRGLKPKRKLSDSLSIYSNAGEAPSSPGYASSSAPSVDRKLKPLTTPKKQQESDDETTIMLRKLRAAPSPTPPTSRRSCDSLSIDNDNEQIYHYLDVACNDHNKILEYLDLHFDNKSNLNQQQQQQRSLMKKTSMEPLHSPGAITVYKEVDFMKTEAFNITRNNLEKERNNVPILNKK